MRFGIFILPSLLYYYMYNCLSTIFVIFYLKSSHPVDLNCFVKEAL
nr:MAG TPA: hypothetical protein [Caudoviricetes sp.]